jgi:hypothetical protein
VLELLLCLADLFWSEHALVSTEERYNARAGLQLMCGHGEALWELQYTNFCGGCSAEAVLSVPVYRALGGTVLAWKLVPLSFHLGILALGAWVLRRLGGLESAVIWMALFIGAPAFYRSLALTGFGNHAEVGLFPLLSLVLIGVAASQESKLHQGVLALMAGLVSGLGLWFSYTSAFALPALALVAGLALRTQALPILAGLPLGFVPWWRYHGRTEGGVDGALDRWLQVDFAPLGAFKRWLWSDPVSSLWPAEEPGLDQAIWWLLLLGLAGWGMRALVLDREKGALRWWPLVALFGLLAAWWIRHDLWSDNPPVMAYDPFNMRYRVPLIPLLFLGAAASVVRERDRLGLRVILALLVVMGLGQRLAAWEPGSQQVLAGVYEPGPEPDRTVPSGDPPQRRLGGMSRPQDLQAALDFLDGHVDPLDECRQDHVSELGRRAGLALRQSKDSPVIGTLAERWSQLSVGEREALASGLDRGLQTGTGSVSKKAARSRLLMAIPELRLE